MQYALTASQDQNDLNVLCEEKLATDGFAPVSESSTSKVDLVAAIWSISAVKRIARGAMSRITDGARSSRQSMKVMEEPDLSVDDDGLIRACACLADANNYARRLQRRLKTLEQQKNDKEFQTVGPGAPGALVRAGSTNGSARNLVSSRSTSYRRLPGELASSVKEISSEDWTKVVLASSPSEAVQLRAQQQKLESRLQKQPILPRIAASLLISQNMQRKGSSANDERGRVIPPAHRALDVGLLTKLCIAIVCIYLLFATLFILTFFSSQSSGENAQSAVEANKAACLFVAMTLLVSMRRG